MVEPKPFVSLAGRATTAQERPESPRFMLWRFAGCRRRGNFLCVLPRVHFTENLAGDQLLRFPHAFLQVQVQHLERITESAKATRARLAGVAKRRLCRLGQRLIGPRLRHNGDIGIAGWQVVGKGFCAQRSEEATTVPLINLENEYRG